MPEMEEISEQTEGAGAGPTRFSAGMIAFHWISALMVIVLLATGWWMLELIRDPARMKSAFPIFQFHKSLGMLVFAVTLGRIALRVRRRTPDLPGTMPGWERVVALVAQAIFYLLLVAIPITGWLYISTEWAQSLDKEFKAPTLFFGQFAVPYVGFISEAEAGLRRALSFRLSGVHGWLAYGLLALIVLHAAAALTHHFLEKDNVLPHMVPILRRGAKIEGDRTVPQTRLTNPKVWMAAVASVIVLAALGWMASPAPPQLATDKADHSAAD